MCSYPWATVTSQPWRLGVRSIEELHVVVAAVRLLLNLKGLEDELHAVAFLRRDHPLTVGGSGVVIVPKLCMREQVLGFDFSLQATSTLCEQKSWVELFVDKLHVQLLWSLVCLWLYSHPDTKEYPLLLNMSHNHSQTGRWTMTKTKSCMFYTQKPFWRLMWVNALKLPWCP